MTEFEHIREEAQKKFEEKLAHRHRFGHREHGRGGRLWTGLFIVIIGIMTLLRSFELPLPGWLFSWQMFLIGLGLFLGLRHGFKRGGWFVPILVGVIFLANDYLLDMSLRKHLWPVALIVVGIMFIIRPKGTCAPDRHWREKKKRLKQFYESMEPLEDFNAEDVLDSTAVFGSFKKNILSKNFKGGDIVNVFGGTELNMSQADIQGAATLEISAIFGGSTLIIPSNWVLKSEVVTIFGGIQDKRSVPMLNENPEKMLLLRGTVLFGGIEIKSF